LAYLGNNVAETEEKEFQQRIQRIEALVHRIESLVDIEARTSALELFQSIMDLHGAGLERMLSIAFDAGGPGRAIIDKFSGDGLVSSLLLLYGLHPLDFETRVMQALDKVRPYLQSHGGNVSLLEIRDGAVRLKLEGSCHGCGSSAETLKQMIEQAIYDAAPDIMALEVQGVVEQQAAPKLVQLGMAGQRASAAD
jgi:Fe-S cluster biogenesis protein NfuA